MRRYWKKPSALFELEPQHRLSSLVLQGADKLTCLHSSCRADCHVICLAKRFLKSEPSHLLPVEGACPSCCRSVFWGDVIRQRSGCSADLPDVTSAAVRRSTKLHLTGSTQWEYDKIFLLIIIDLSFLSSDLQSALKNSTVV